MNVIEKDPEDLSRKIGQRSLAGVGAVDQSSFRDYGLLQRTALNLMELLAGRGLEVAIQDGRLLQEPLLTLHD
jgi:hypothetical protein